MSTATHATRQAAHVIILTGPENGGKLMAKFNAGKKEAKIVQPQRKIDDGATKR